MFSLLTADSSLTLALYVLSLTLVLLGLLPLLRLLTGLPALKAGAARLDLDGLLLGGNKLLLLLPLLGLLLFLSLFLL